MDLPTIIALVTFVVAVITFFPTLLSWREARLQRRIAERALPPPDAEAESASTTTPELGWRCGIYDYPPLSSWPALSEAKPSGPLVWLAQHIAESVGKSARFQRFAYDDFYSSDKNIPDMVVGMFETKRRSSRVVFSRSIYEIGLQGICRREQKGDVLRDLREGT